MSLRELGQVIHGRGELRRETRRMRDEDIARRGFAAAAARLAFAAGSGTTVIRPTGPILAQPMFPCCAGQGGAGAMNWRLARARKVDPRTGGSYRASGVSLWRDARRRRWGWAGMQDIESGSYGRDVLESICVRGVDPYRAGEDTDPEEAGRGAPTAGDDLLDELAAHDMRIPHAERYRLTEAVSDIGDAVEIAFSNPQTELLLSSGCRDAFFRLRPHPDQPDVIVTSEMRGGEDNGHLERLIGVTRENGKLYVYGQGSWTERFAGCHAPDGTWLPGCWKGDESVLMAAWVIDCLVLPDGW